MIRPGCWRALEKKVTTLEAQNEKLSERFARLEAGSSQKIASLLDGSRSQLALLGLGLMGVFLLRSRKETAKKKI